MTRDHAKFIALFEVRGWACKTDEKTRRPSGRIMFAELVYSRPAGNAAPPYSWRALQGRIDRDDYPLNPPWPPPAAEAAELQPHLNDAYA